MAYTKTNWENSPSTNTPLNATNLNKIEDELVNLDKIFNNSGTQLTASDDMNNVLTPRSL